MKYRLLKDGEIIRKGDQHFNYQKQWTCDTDATSGSFMVGKVWDSFWVPYRRPIKPVSRTSTNSRFSKCPHCHQVIRRALPKAATVVKHKTRKV